MKNKKQSRAINWNDLVLDRETETAYIYYCPNTGRLISIPKD